MNFGERVKQARLERKMTLLEVAERLGRTEATVQRYESGNIKNPKSDTIQELADALKVSPSYLMGWEDKLPSNVHALSGQTVRIPILGSISCGDPLLAEENIKGYRNESAELLPSGELYYLEANGDSMEPSIPNGSLVLMRRQPEVENGQVAAVLINGDEEATLKRVRIQNGDMILYPDNNKHSPIFVTDNNPIQIIGLAVEVKYKL
ncbi:helix-turn-helix domain-containing protein [Sporosarcina sp. Sa2YVA2]|uniref:Helix-turn-helix domain-containing protein n=1 Tax=Sporosarcina quadrami TaxID=2762234 RepID=A0ABR8U9G8_9BACL|nr:XRE family transcriptional regulator [Sporosarcina quadrami]MBD7984450.1 helix-turn-helix domain-containing protein [Sporosarcina quadrami]